MSSFEGDGVSACSRECVAPGHDQYKRSVSGAIGTGGIGPSRSRVGWDGGRKAAVVNFGSGKIVANDVVNGLCGSRDRICEITRGLVGSKSRTCSHSIVEFVFKIKGGPEVRNPDCDHYQQGQ